MTREIEILAAEYALGTLDQEKRTEVAHAATGDRALRDAIETWEHRFALLEVTSPLETPPADLWNRVAERVEMDEPTGLRSHTVYADEGTWNEVLPGARVKLLMADEEAGTRSYLMRLAPGVQLPSHQHVRMEECMMLEGDLTIGSLSLQAGDYHAILPGAAHRAGFSRNGCLIFVRGDPDLHPA